MSLIYVINFLEKKRAQLLLDMQLQGVGEGNVDHRPFQINSIKKAIAILEARKGEDE